jgi:hypothetical protein
MKFWIEAVLEDGDSLKKCGECEKALFVPDHVFCEFILRQGGLPNTDEIHPEPTGKFMCSGCAKTILI